VKWGSVFSIYQIENCQEQRVKEHQLLISKCCPAFDFPVYGCYADLDFTLLEMNPFTIVDATPYPLDMRGELDDTALFKNFQKYGFVAFALSTCFFSVSI
jgi:succinyl-CoA synthetase beta subunit